MLTKAVIPVAGMGTRLLPTTKSQPKEMLPLGRKPCVQHIVEELAGAGLKDFLFVTGANKRSIDINPELIARLITGDNISSQYNIIRRIISGESDTYRTDY